MSKMPEPDSAEMGWCVDRWLHDLRLRGATSRELGRIVRRLAAAVVSGRESSVLRDFQRFVAGDSRDVDRRATPVDFCGLDTTDDDQQS